MSHYRAVVLMSYEDVTGRDQPKGWRVSKKWLVENADAIHERVDTLMAPYDEKLSVEEYTEPCYDCEGQGGDCPECNGTGKSDETWFINPKAKWDWYRVGGRYDGFMLDLPPLYDEHGGFNFAQKFTTLERNVCKVKNAFTESGYTPYAIVYPDGTWRDLDTDYDDVDWLDDQDNYADHLAILLDFHI